MSAAQRREPILERPHRPGGVGVTGPVEDLSTRAPTKRGDPDGLEGRG